jgi:hypothetical protein
MSSKKPNNNNQIATPTTNMPILCDIMRSVQSLWTFVGSQRSVYINPFYNRKLLFAYVFRSVFETSFTHHTLTHTLTHTHSRTNNDVLRQQQQQRRRPIDRRADGESRAERIVCAVVDAGTNRIESMNRWCMISFVV